MKVIVSKVRKRKNYEKYSRQLCELHRRPNYRWSISSLQPMKYFPTDRLISPERKRMFTDRIECSLKSLQVFSMDWSLNQIRFRLLRMEKRKIDAIEFLRFSIDHSRIFSKFQRQDLSDLRAFFRDNVNSILWRLSWCSLRLLQKMVFSGWTFHRSWFQLPKYLQGSCTVVDKIFLAPCIREFRSDRRQRLF